MQQLKKTYCVLNNPNFNYLCDLHLSYIVNNYKYYARINKYINLVLYRKCDVITIIYNKNNLSEIEIKDNKYLYGIIHYLLVF
mgnify:CR=1 FL=1|jgi:hypothetical protein